MKVKRPRQEPRALKKRAERTQPYCSIVSVRLCPRSSTRFKARGIIGWLSLKDNSCVLAKPSDRLRKLSLEAGIVRAAMFFNSQGQKPWLFLFFTPASPTFSNLKCALRRSQVRVFCRLLLKPVP